MSVILEVYSVFSKREIIPWKPLEKALSIVQGSYLKNAMELGLISDAEFAVDGLNWGFVTDPYLKANSSAW